MRYLVGLFFLALPLFSDLSRGAEKKGPVDKKKEKSELSGKKESFRKLSNEELKRMQNKLQALNFLSVDFNQKSYSPLRKKTTTYVGRARFAKPALFRWTQERPVAKELIYDGKDLYIYFPQEKVANKFSAKGSQANEIEKLSGIVLNFDKLVTYYELVESLYSDRSRILVMHLQPKTVTDIEKVQVSISTLENYIMQVKISYKNGRIHTYDFSSPSKVKLAADQFVFSPPKGVKLEVFD